MIQEALELLAQRKDLSVIQMQACMEEIMNGRVDTPQIAAFLSALSEKTETVEEITAAVAVMRRFATRVPVCRKDVLDTCGTGGDKKGTFNVSTAVAFIASGAGITVAKHGNRAVSSSSGSADVLEALGIAIHMPVERITACLEKAGIAFLFAPDLHPAMKFAMPARKQLGRRTIFNIVGPLSNPASATHQLIGVFDGKLTGVVARVLGNLGTVHALVVHGQDGLDEITTTALTQVSEINRGRLTEYTLSPEDLGFKRAQLADLAGGSAQENAQIILDILNGEKGYRRDIALLNAGAAIYAADKAVSLEDGIRRAEESLDTKKALEKFTLLKEYAHQ